MRTEKAFFPFYDSFNISPTKLLIAISWWNFHDSWQEIVKITRNKNLPYVKKPAMFLTVKRP